MTDPTDAELRALCDKAGNGVPADREAIETTAEERRSAYSFVQIHTGDDGSVILVGERVLALLRDHDRQAAEIDHLTAALAEARAAAQSWEGTADARTADAKRARAALAEAKAEAARARAEERKACVLTALEQRCERGTPWDLACTTIADAIRSRTETRAQNKLAL